MKIPALLTPKRIALLIAALYAPTSLASMAARVEFSTGDPVLRGSDGKERPVRKGDTLASGERILTRNGRVQLAFTDGAFVSLQPETDFGIEQYEFKGKTDGTEKGFFSMLKGSLRTITGMIGRGRRDAYRIQTPTATIGIRGTGGLIQVSNAGTYIFGTSGIWTLSNGLGTISIPSGTPGFASSSGNTPPQTGGTTPSAPPPGAGVTGTGSSGATAGTGTTETPTYVSANQTTSSGTSAAVGSITPILTGGAGYGVLHVSSIDGNTNIVTGSTTAFTAGTTLNSFTDAATPPVTVTQGTTTVAESGTDGIIGWGRWTNGTYQASYPSTLTSQQGLHYITGIPTASMPTTGTASYSFVAATSPTGTLTSPGPTTTDLTLGTFSFGSFVANFSNATASLNFGVSINGNTYNASASGLSFANTNKFNGLLAVTSSTACSCGCNGNVSGLFFGPAAERAGIAYRINDNGISTSSLIIGTAAFRAP